MAFKCRELTEMLFSGEGEHCNEHSCQGHSRKPDTTDTQEHKPCCAKDDDDDQGRKHGYRLADLASFRTELRRVLLHPPA